MDIFGDVRVPAYHIVELLGIGCQIVQLGHTPEQGCIAGTNVPQ